MVMKAIFPAEKVSHNFITFQREVRLREQQTV
jgi:hypothetical protein